MFCDRVFLTDAVLELLKTMTRRSIPLTEADRLYLENAFDWDLREKVIIDRYAQYKVGDIVAVAQSYKSAGFDPDIKIRCKGKWWTAEYTKGWNNKMFVRADEMPHFIRITDIKIERLQDISNEDCLKEGIKIVDRFEQYVYYSFDGWRFRDGKKRCSESPRDAFAVLIDKVSGKGTWDNNPWVFAYSFKLVK